MQLMVLETGISSLENSRVPVILGKFLLLVSLSPYP